MEKLLNFNNSIDKYYKLNNSKYNYFDLICPFAIYFPQYHYIPENNKWFYEGS